MENCIKDLQDLRNFNADKGVSLFFGIHPESIEYHSVSYTKLYHVISKTSSKFGFNVDQYLNYIDTVLIEFSHLIQDEIKGVNQTLSARCQVDDWKHDLKLIEEMINSVLYLDEESDITLLSKSSLKPDNTCDACVLYDKKLNYCPYRYIWLSMKGDDCQYHIQYCDFRTKSYRFVARKLIKLLYNLLYNNAGLKSNRPLLRLILTPITSYSHFYETMNPVGNASKEECINTIEMLTLPSKQSQVINNTSNREILITLDVVMDDIQNTDLRYIQNIKTVLSNFEILPFNERDYYYSLKATPKKVNGKQMKSLFSSIYEDDPIKDFEWTKAFDERFGYRSSYSETKSYISGCNIKTTRIDNPGKYKGRAIHIACNAIQDRCSFIHNRLMSIENSLIESCVKNQFKGVQFLLDATSKWVQQKDRSQGASLYNFDFTNATDTLDQEVQRKVINFFLGQEAGNFFYEISRLEKHFIYNELRSSKDYQVDIPYIQSYGQPQGLLGSFDGFNLFHYLLMLGVMKQAGLENYPSSKFFRILGDDSAIYTIVPDEEGTIPEIYRRLAQSANLIINLDKSNLIYHDPDKAFATIDFAKVSVTNGEIDSPIPFRLISQCGNNLGLYATAFWVLAKNLQYKEEFLLSVLEEDSNQEFSSWFYSIYRAGLTSYYYNEESFKWDPVVALHAVIICYSMLTKNLWEKDISHKDRHNRRPSLVLQELDKLLLTNVNKSDLNTDLDLLDPHHKINNIRVKNHDIAKILQNSVLYTETDTVFDLLYSLYTDQLSNLITSETLLNLLIAFRDIMNINEDYSLEDWFHNLSFNFNDLKELLYSNDTNNVLIKDVKHPNKLSVAYESSYVLFKQYTNYLNGVAQLNIEVENSDKST